MKLVGPQVFFDEELHFLRYLPIDNVESDDRIWLQLLQGLTLCRVQSFVSYFQNWEPFKKVRVRVSREKVRIIVFLVGSYKKWVYPWNV